jgi:signal transduction histidine kinase
MFFRANNSIASGSGIGLYIVKEALEKLNGNVSVNSIEGKGSTFSITLPIL